MSTKTSFPFPHVSTPARGPVPITSHTPNVAGDYPGAPMQSDKMTLANVPMREQVPGDGMPGEAWQTPKIPARRRIR